MIYLIAEVGDKVGTGYEPAVLAVLVSSVMLALARWSRRIPLVLILAACALGNVVLAKEMNSWIGVAILDEIGWSHYVRAFVAWNLPLALAAALIPIVRRRPPNLAPGHCPTCGYDLRGELAAGCPECGWGRSEEDLHARR